MSETTLVNQQNIFNFKLAPQLRKIGEGVQTVSNDPLCRALNQVETRRDSLQPRDHLSDEQVEGHD